MGFWSRLTGKFRTRGVLSRAPEEAEDPVEEVRLLRPQPTPTGRVPERPQETPSGRPREVEGGTAGTPSYGDQGDTPSTRRIHNPRPSR